VLYINIVASCCLTTLTDELFSVQLLTIAIFISFEMMMASPNTIDFLKEV
jgi:hypothetical protein